MAEALRKGTDRLVVAFSSFSGGDLDQEVVGALADAGVPFLESTETAMLALRNAREHRRFLDRPAAASPGGVGRGEPRELNGTLGNADATRLLRDFGVPLAETIAAKDSGRGGTSCGPSGVSRGAQDRLVTHRAQDRRGRRPRRLRRRHGGARGLSGHAR